MFLQAEVAGISADRILSVAAIVLSPASAVFAAWLVNRNRDRRVVDRDDFKVHREAFESRIAQCERERDHWIARARDAGQENEALRRLATEAAVRQERVAERNRRGATRDPRATPSHRSHAAERTPSPRGRLTC
jgi:hypothetical protein